MEKLIQADRPGPAMALAGEHKQVLEKIRELYLDLFLHDGYGTLRVEMRFLKKGQKEILVICGKEYRYVVDYNADQNP